MEYTLTRPVQCYSITCDLDKLRTSMKLERQFTTGECLFNVDCSSNYHVMGEVSALISLGQSKLGSISSTAVG